MKRQESKKETMGKVYREFSRQKYNKYKHQFPKMKESQIVSKIIREWDALNSDAKDKLLSQYEKNKELTQEDISESEAIRKTVSKTATKSAKIETPVKKVSKVRMFVDKPEPKYSSPSDSDKKSSNKMDDSNSPNIVIVPSKTKGIKKTARSNEEYIAFYRHYYQRTAQEHPKWQPLQISTIIKLLWKKKKRSEKISHSAKGGLKRKLKVLSGRRYYRKVRGLDGKEARLIWKRFPRQTKSKWEREAKGEYHSSKKRPQVIKLKFKNSQEEFASLRFFKNQLN